MDIILSSLLLLYGLMGGNGDQDITAQQLAVSYINAAAGTTIVQPAEGYPALPGESDNSAPAAKTDPQPDAPEIKGIYVSAYSAGGARMPSLIKLVDDTELNSMVIDMKDDNGYITYATETPELLDLGTPQKYIGDIKGLMDTLKQHNIYPIARIVTFKDTMLATKHPELSFLQADGTLLKNSKGESFVNPYSEKVWKYNVDIAKEAARLGFKEIQFDYVRFPEGFETNADTLTYEKTDKSRVDTIAGFVKYARQQLEPLGVRVSVDIFGYAASVPAAQGIGQDFVKISNDVHVISPMIYPSHYSSGWFHLDDPDMNPYATIKGAMEDTHKKLDPMGSLKPVIRPWIQDFTANWLGRGHYMKYGKEQVEQQIKALKDSGVNEYLLWNAGNKYSFDTSASADPD
ncbi:putative glycoside hydrolase [Paenibacillus protaetiae]|uniref:GTP-binding protein n=1 Tax=Paenibacillus protaetiae TaxID=2509456 RepID=A0A4P6F5D7_9BACL|nr:putative glycoside hydrolase [Paenibacillus protaetiae]QAY68417.1 GTP-binding protein [Paenibacillus protaetiae]